jgi:hypothetical protein
MYAAAIIGDKIIDLAGWDQGQGAETSGLNISSNYNFQDVAYIGGTYGRQFFRPGTMVSASFTSRFELSDTLTSQYQNRVTYFLRTMPVRLSNQSGCIFKLSQQYSGLFVPQWESITGTGTITLAGNAKITLTSAAIDSSPLVIKFPVTLGQTPSQWMVTARSYYDQSPEVRQFYNVSGAGSVLDIRRKSPYAVNDSTLLMVISNDTCTGITSSSSVEVSAGSSVLWPNEMTFYDANVAVAVTQLGTSVMLNTSVTGRLTSP